MHKRIVAAIVARILLFGCAIMLVPLGLAAYNNWHSHETTAFLITICLGVTLCILLLWKLPLQKADYSRLNVKDGLAIVGLAWLTLSFWGAIPLYLGQVTAGFTDAFFEIVSGFTTTGASIFADVEILPRGILFWRSLTHWVGGMGIVVLFLALLPALSQNGFQLYKAEASGISVEKIEPRIKETAKILWVVYLSLSALQVILHLVGGMSLFDSLCHTFGTIATGGFSTKNASMGAFSAYHQWVVMAFMSLGGTSFMLHYQAVRYGRWWYWRNEEFRCYLGLSICLIVVFAAVLYYKGLSDSPLRDAAFQVISISSSTGFATADFNLWPQGMRFVFLLLMISGACAGSTSGGLKVIRVVLGVKIAARSVRQSLFPNAVLPLKVDNRVLSNKVVEEVASFFVAYLLLFLTGALLLTVTDSCSFDTALSAAAATFGNIGPGLDAVGAMTNYGGLSIPGKWILIFLMLAGRLELYAILVLFLPATWKK